MNSKLTFLLSILLVFTFSCKTNSQTDETVDIPQKTDSTLNQISYPCKKISRTEIVEKLENKISNKQPLYVHIFVPLCDDIHQGIVPTNSSLGDGLNLKTNLY